MEGDAEKERRQSRLKNGHEERRLQELKERREMANLRKKLENVTRYLYWRYRLRIRLRQERARKRTTDFLAVPSLCLTELIRKHGYSHVVHIPNMVDIDMDGVIPAEGKERLDKSDTVGTNAANAQVMKAPQTTQASRVTQVTSSSKAAPVHEPWDPFVRTRPGLSNLREAAGPSGTGKNKPGGCDEWGNPMEGLAGALIRELRAEVEDDWKVRMACRAQNGGQIKSFPPGRKRLLYYCGSIRSSKGVFWLLENYRQQDYQNLELHLVGLLDLNDEDRAGRTMWREEATECRDDGTESQTERFYRLLRESQAIYEGEVTREKLIRILQRAYAVIIPSISFENYPNVGLEAIACNCLVCGADNGGIPEMVSSEKLLFRHGSQTIDGKNRSKLSNGTIKKILRSDNICYENSGCDEILRSMRECLRYLDHMPCT